METVQRACDRTTGERSRRGPAPAKRLPLAPLVRLVELHRGERVPVVELAAMFGLSRAGASTIHAARKTGITEACADRWSIAAGFHPTLVWGIAWFEAGETR